MNKQDNAAHNLRIYAESIPQTTSRTPIEVLLKIGEDERVSSRDVYKFLELTEGQYSRWCRSNIVENQFAESGADYEGFDIYVGGNLTTDYRLSIPFAKKICMCSRTERGEQARDYFIKVEDALKRTVAALPSLTPNEVLLQVIQSVVEQERKTKEIENRLDFTEQRLIETGDKFDKAIQTLANPSLSWEDNMKVSIAQLVEGGDGWMHKRVLGRMYRELEAITSCDLANRVSRKKSRMKKQGVTYKQRVGVTKLCVISDDNHLRKAFEGIVKRYQAEMISCM